MAETRLREVKLLRAVFLAAATLSALCACAPAPVRTGTQNEAPAFVGTVIPRTWTPSPNFDTRRPNIVVIHHTGSDTAARALATLTDRQRGVSAHYLIVRDGSLIQLVDERMRAWHAGDSRWAGNTDLNSSSIGIELDNTGAEPFPEAQIVSLLALLTDLRQRYRIPAANVIGHSDIAPRRKVDPSHHFPWRRLADQGFGLWCGTPASALPPASPGTASILLLQGIGYDVSDPPAAFMAFRRHFLDDPNNKPTDAQLNDAERALAQCLVQRKVDEALRTGM